ncbi:hypothetical protein B0T26DRAFT_803397 [Lasiosphaeria miniovina]|uniref:FAD-binding domain-containing protein n=1 Tax=Lasiosphaeria miniovina TaxID=1954250 RepID=A0AA40AMR4_9PEZI|nr:uncharacterized protein B0T26DRAFT_803397 [Lasiosphaeria miniovina]KAK0718587.1 hypothetical protein B0T26DRAFT_803397 [Lasiosphaeria miniovina]
MTDTTTHMRIAFVSGWLAGACRRTRPASCSHVFLHLYLRAMCSNPLTEASAALGSQDFDVDRQYGWVGSATARSSCMTSLRTGRSCTWAAPSGVVMAHPGPRLAEPAGYSQWEQKSTLTHARGRVYIVGDVAHATTWWQGAGAGQAFEGAAILGALFGRVARPGDIDAAFKAFDAARRPRLKAAFAPRWAFISSLDLDEYKREALDTSSDSQEAGVLHAESWWFK